MSDKCLAELKKSFPNYKDYMTEKRLQQQVQDNVGTILSGRFIKDQTDLILHISKFFTTEKNTVYFENKWRFIEKLDAKSINEILIPHIRIELNKMLPEVNCQHIQYRLCEYAAAFRICEKRIADSGCRHFGCDKHLRHNYLKKLLKGINDA